MVNQLNLEFLNQAKNPLVKKYENNSAKIQNGPLKYVKVKCCTVMHCTILYFTLLYCAVLHCSVLYCTVLYCTVLYCTVLYCTVLYCTVLYCTELYLTALKWIVLYCVQDVGMDAISASPQDLTQCFICIR